jgi:stress response protein SCP2
MFKPKTNIPTPLHAYRMNTAERGATGLMRKDESLRDIVPYSFGAGEVGQAQTFKTAPSATDPMALNQQSVGQMLKGPETDEQAMARLSQTRPTRGQTMAAMEGLQGSGNEAYQQFSANLANTGEEARKYADVGTVALKQARKSVDKAAIKAEQMEESRGTASTIGKFSLLGADMAAASMIKDPAERRARMTESLSAVGAEAIQGGLDSALKNLGASEEMASTLSTPLSQGITGSIAALASGSPRQAVKQAASTAGQAAGAIIGSPAGPVGAEVGRRIGGSISNIFPGGSGRSNYLGGTARAGGLKTASEMLKG